MISCRHALGHWTLGAPGACGDMKLYSLLNVLPSPTRYQNLRRIRDARFEHAHTWRYCAGVAFAGSASLLCMELGSMLESGQLIAQRLPSRQAQQVSSLRPASQLKPPRESDRRIEQPDRCIG